MNKHSLFLMILFSTFLTAGISWAHDEDAEENEKFIFGNHIDTHQSTAIDDNELKGTFNISFTGEFNGNGVPVAKHCDLNTPPDKCVVGWKLKGKPGEATFVYHNMDHPVWIVDTRDDIPQPGAYSHFHWITMESNDTREVNDMRCNVPKAGMLQRGARCPGYFLQLKAVRTFVFLHGNDEVLIKKGIDLASHLNIITSLDPSAALIN